MLVISAAVTFKMMVLVRMLTFFRGDVDGGEVHDGSCGDVNDLGG